MTAVVVDASALVAALSDDGPSGSWVTEAIADGQLAAPELALFEAANVLRRLELRELVSTAEASMAHADLLELPLELWPYAALGPRAWALRGSPTVYDAAYVALAELLQAPLITLDIGLARAGASIVEVHTPS